MDEPENVQVRFVIVTEYVTIWCFDSIDITKKKSSHALFFMVELGWN